MHKLPLNDLGIRHNIAYTREDLGEDFIKSNASIINAKRGAGYWLWKPYIIYKTMQSMDDGEFVMYLDSGSTITHNVQVLFNVCRDVGGILLFENRNGNPQGKMWQNYMWTKGDCFKEMGCIETKYYNGNQCAGSPQIYQKNPKTMAFVKEYLDYCCNPIIITDMISCIKNHNMFVDHRHDQSVLSLLAIKHDIPLQPDPYQYGEGHRPTDCPYGTLIQHHRGRPFGRN